LFQQNRPLAAVCRGRYPLETVQPTPSGYRAVPLFKELQAYEPRLDFQLLNGVDVFLVADFLDDAYAAEMLLAVEDRKNACLRLVPEALGQGTGGAVLGRKGERYLANAASYGLPIGQDQFLVHGNPGFDVAAVRGRMV
ncbi:hypothetical protein, partial [Pseudomonas cichorii]|uniref:hypothetical protein n=1 Tax=Pseudomonas cichorii TaxID=36746 RepID=UPI001E307886